MRKRHSATNGQATVEYALLIALMTVVCVLILTLLGVGLRDVYCLIMRPLGIDDACEHYFFDPFTSGLDKWDIISGRWDVNDGRLCGGPGEGRMFTDIPADDYVIDISSATLSQGNGYGVFFRATDTPDFNGYSFQYDPGYQAFIYRKWVNGRELWPPFAVARVRDYDWNAPRHIELKVQGDTFTTYVDGQPVLTATDSTYSEGGIGLRTWDNTKVCFDDLTVDAVH